MAYSTSVGGSMTSLRFSDKMAFTTTEDSNAPSPFSFAIAAIFSEVASARAWTRFCKSRGFFRDRKCTCVDRFCKSREAPSRIGINQTSPKVPKASNKSDWLPNAICSSGMRTVGIPASQIRLTNLNRPPRWPTSPVTSILF